ncbi:hypothetical protein AB0O75_23390 [Streptomyces sp. NPDC088921]|uniref:hypothetical protein n=1 Tax=unclassified Streptomyces TaxID=2593676 RepID=UPI00342FD6F7
MRAVLGEVRGRAGRALIDGADDCFAVGEAGHQVLFRRVVAVVHHGRPGRSAPGGRTPDRRPAEPGIGGAHDGPTPTYESLTAGLAKAAAESLPDMAGRACSRVARPSWS